MFKTLLLGLATATTLVSAAPVLSSPFTIDIHNVDTKINHGLLAVKNGSDYVLQVIPISELNTNFVFGGKGKGQQDYKSLLYEGKDSDYWGFFVPEIGDSYGVTGAVIGYPEETQVQWEESTGDNHQILHKPQAALNSFYTCPDSTPAGEGKFLHWGTPFTNGTNPDGCDLVTLHAA